MAKVRDPSLTPSAQVLAAMAEHQESFAQFSLRQSKAHAEFFRAEPLPAEEQTAFEENARESLVQQTELEQNEVGISMCSWVRIRRAFWRSVTDPEDASLACTVGAAEGCDL